MLSFNNKQKFKVLVVDSEGPGVEQLIKNLIDTNLEVIHIKDGQKACEYCLKNQPHIIITELDLPLVNGIQFFRQVKSNFITSHIPIIVTTKETKLEDRVKSMEIGIDDYIEKPYAPEEIVARVHLLLNEIKIIEKNRRIINHGFKGNLEEMNVVDLLKTMELSRMSGIIYLTRGYKEGQIFIDKGAIVDAFINGYEPEQALSHMLTWLKGIFWVSIQNIDRTRMINENNTTIISKGTKLIQKWKDLTRQLPPLNTPVKAIQPDENKKITNPEKQMLDHYSEPNTIMHGIEKSKMDDLHALELIKSLLQKGLLVTKSSSHQVKDPFAQIVFDHMNRENDNEETFTKITSFFKRENNPQKPYPSEAGYNLVRTKDQNDPPPRHSKTPFKVLLSKKDLQLIKKAINRI